MQVANVREMLFLTAKITPSFTTAGINNIWALPGKEKVKRANVYMEMREKHQEEISKFPMFFAFSNEQFEIGMKKFGLSPTDTDKIGRLGDLSGFYKLTDGPRLREMFDRHHREMQAAIDNDGTGEGFIFDMFFYELGNYEYVYTNDVTDTLDALGLTIEKVRGDQKLLFGLKKAIKARHMEDCEV
jgi:hypothetical protein